jgi:hypothetical protein
VRYSRRLIFLFTFCFQLQAFPQPTLYAVKNSNQVFKFVSIDCSNDSVVELSQFNFTYFSTFLSSCFDNSTNTYYLCLGRWVFKIDALTGIVDSTGLAIPNTDQFVHIVFNPRDQLIYGIVQNTINLSQKWGKYDPVSKALDTLTLLSSYVKNGIGCKSVFNPLTQEYFIQSNFLAKVDITTGHVLSNDSILNHPQEALDHIAFSCKTQSIYGLSNNFHVDSEYFAVIDTATANVTHITPSPMPVFFYKQLLSGSTIDNSTDIYYYPASGGIIYGIDINTGNIVYSHNFGPGIDFYFLESASNYYCPISEVVNVTNQSLVNPYPNPGNGLFNFDLSQFNFMESVITIVDAQGKEVLVFHEGKSNFQIDLSGFASGIYFYRIVNKMDVFSGKLVLQDD